MQAFPSIIWSECISTLDPASRQNTKSYSYLFGLKSLKYPAAILLYVPLDLEQQKYIFLVLQKQVFKTKYATSI